MTASDDVRGARPEQGPVRPLRLRRGAERAGTLLALALLCAAGASPLSADGRKPGSLLVYPINRVKSAFTTISVTNTNLQPPIGVTQGGATNVHFHYVNQLPDPTSKFKPLDCFVNNRTEFLTPGDTTTHLTNCHNFTPYDGYVVVVAEDPLLQTLAWSHNYLIGSEIVVNPNGGVYSLNAIPFRSLQPGRTATDRDGDGQYDLDGIEYEGAPEHLLIDSFMAFDSTGIVLLNATGGFAFDATMRFDVWNDNEFPLSALLTFRCWFEAPLRDVSLVFDGFFLANNTPDDPSELDTDCDGVDDIQTGWARIRGIQASSTAQSLLNPAVLGALTPTDDKLIDCAKLLWESPERQLNGDFFKFGSVDPEFPE